MRVILPAPMQRLKVFFQEIRNISTSNLLLLAEESGRKILILLFLFSLLTFTFGEGKGDEESGKMTTLYHLSLNVQKTEKLSLYSLSLRIRFLSFTFYSFSKRKNILIFCPTQLPG